MKIKFQAIYDMMIQLKIRLGQRPLFLFYDHTQGF